ncbi:MAG: right-handed parallel beta-helix repeat-containing protein [Planctomycetota bacterium]
MRYFIALLVLISNFIAGTATAVDYYVSTTGLDANPGTISQPWRTVAKVNGRNLAPGDHVYFAGGQTFTDTGLVLGSGDGGNAANRVVIGSYGTGRAIIKPASAHGCDIYNVAGFTIQDVIFEGPGLTTSAKKGLQTYCDLAGGVRVSGLTIARCEFRQFLIGIEIGAWHTSYSGFQDVLIDTCVVHDCRRNGITSYGYTPSSATQLSHRNIIVRDCAVYGVTGDPSFTTSHSGSGIVISGVKGATIERCYAHNNGGSAGNTGGGGPVGIWTYAADSVTIQRCLVHDQKTTPGVADGGGFDIDGGSTNAIIQYCFSYNNEGAGFLIAEYSGASPITNGIIRYNVSWKDARRKSMGSLHFWNGTTSAANCSGIAIYNNTIYADAAVGGPAINFQSGPMTGITLRNNAIIVAGGAKLVKVASNTAAFTFTGNSWFAADGNYAGGWTWGATTYASLAAWRAAAGTPETVSGAPVGQQGDSKLNSPITGAQPTSIAALDTITAFAPRSGSPLVDAGLDLTSASFGSMVVGSRDFTGNAIPAGAGYDIGACEQPVASAIAPTITTQPTNAAVTAPATATFSVVATGTPTPTYQWQSAPSGSSTFTAISGATLASYTTTATTTAMTGMQYRCVVTNSAGAATSTVATLTVTAAPVAPTITTQPVNKIVTAPATATFSVVATGTPAPTYQWQSAPSGSSTFTAISGAIAASYTTAATTTAMTGMQYRCVVTNSAGSVTTSVATLTVNPTPIAPAITTQPLNKTVTAPATATFSVVATGTPAPTYQWQSASSGSSTFTAISGATAASYTTAATTTAMTGMQYRCVVTNSAGTVT